MMHMRSTQMKVEVGDPPGHDQEGEDASGEKCEEEAGQTSRTRWRDEGNAGDLYGVAVIERTGLCGSRSSRRTSPHSEATKYPEPTPQNPATESWVCRCSRPRSVSVRQSHSAQYFAEARVWAK